MDSLTTYRILNTLVDEVGPASMGRESPFLIAPVAEYMGAAIIERPGKVKKLYHGVEYTTDGHTYLILRECEKPGHLSFLQLPDERTAKLVLEQPGQPERFMSYKQVCKLVGLSLVDGRWEWSEDDGRFNPVLQ